MKAFPRDITVKTMKERHIGIESELGVSSNNYQRNCGVPQDVENIIKSKGLFDSAGYDGGGREFRTVPISLKSLYQVRGYKYLCEYFDALKSVTTVLDSGGTHIHISILDSDNPNMESNATAIAIAFFRQFVKISGRETHWASKLLGSTNIIELRDYLYKRRSIITNDRTYVMKGSMLNPTEHQTLELRGPRGSNDKNEVLAWAEFLKNVVDIANQDSVDGLKFKELLKGKRISAYVKSLKFARKLSSKDLNTKLNVNRLIA